MVDHPIMDIPQVLQVAMAARVAVHPATATAMPALVGQVCLDKAQQAATKADNTIPAAAAEQVVLAVVAPQLPTVASASLLPSMGQPITLAAAAVVPDIASTAVTAASAAAAAVRSVPRAAAQASTMAQLVVADARVAGQIPRVATAVPIQAAAAVVVATTMPITKVAKVDRGS